MTGARLAGMVAAALAILPLAAGASDQDDALRLTARVANPGGMGTTVVTLHALPAGFPASIPLPKGSLLGSISHEITALSSIPKGLTHSQTLYYETQNRDATLDDYRAALRAAGWKRAEMDKVFRLPAGTTMTMPQLDAWCSPGEPRNGITVVTPQSDPNALNVQVGLVYSFFACSDDADVRREGTMTTAVVPASNDLPTFTSSPGVTIEYAGPAVDGSTIGARITSKLPLAAVFEVFAKQMRDAGWTPKSASSGNGLQSQTFAKTTAKSVLAGLLAVYALDATHYVAIIDASDVRQ